jgi:alpha-amylase/alpha-mannosidase (GH57 family)
MDAPTKVIFLWHMHQPFYKLPSQNYYYLGWTRLHAVKDYYGMALAVDKFDKLKVTFNFSGVLLKQIVDYTYNRVKDYYLILTLKNPKDLSKEERDFIINRFFSVNFERFIRPNRRFAQLYQYKLSKKKFCPQDILDLQVLFNLAWFHPYTIKEDKNLRALMTKGRHYSQKDKRYIVNKQYQVISKIIPLYKKLYQAGRIEISVSPFYHPILPLIFDTDILKEFPYLKKPLARFSYPQDCQWHLKQSKQIFRDIFKKEVEGSWPSEGSISESVAKLYRQEGFRWIGLNEGILFKSLTTDYVPYDLIKNQRHIIYRPYNFGGLNLFFRDRNLSDAISFIYQGWEDPVFAANDLLEHFKRIHYYTKKFYKESVITIIMDGENAWEYYKNNGVEFLETIYSALEKSHILATTLPHEFLSKVKVKKLERLASGSWINNDFGVWIGSKQNNLNWYILRRIRNLIETRRDKLKNLNKIMEYLYLLEGSDWNWWNTFDDPLGDFKAIFLSYVREIYRLLDKRAPSYVKQYA